MTGIDPWSSKAKEFVVPITGGEEYFEIGLQLTLPFQKKL